MRVLVCAVDAISATRSSSGAYLGGFHKDHGISLPIKVAPPVPTHTLSRLFGAFRLRLSPRREKHGRAAGSIRNKLMLDEGKPDVVIAFPGGRGTANMVRRARAAGLRVIEIS